MVKADTENRIALGVIDVKRDIRKLRHLCLRFGGRCFFQSGFGAGCRDAHRRAEHQAGEQDGGEFWFDGHIEYLP